MRKSILFFVGALTSLGSLSAWAQSPADLINAGKPTSNLAKLGQRGAVTGGSVTNTGAYTMSIPLGLPPARAGLVPSLQIVYSSQAGASRIGYYGWSLTAGYIRRSQRLRAPESTNSPIEFSLAGAQGELVSQGTDPATGYQLYGDRLGQVRWRFLYNAAQEQWIVLLPNGRKYYLGDKNAIGNHCVETDPLGTLAVRWNLCSVQDRESNGIQFTWHKDNCESAPGAPLQTTSVPRLIRATYNLRADSLATAKRYVFFTYTCTPPMDVSHLMVEGQQAHLYDDAYLSKVEVKAEHTSGLPGEPGAGAATSGSSSRTMVLARGPEAPGSPVHNLVSVTPHSRPTTTFRYTQGPTSHSEAVSLTGSAPLSFSRWYTWNPALPPDPGTNFRRAAGPSVSDAQRMLVDLDGDGRLEIVQTNTSNAIDRWLGESHPECSSLAHDKLFVFPMGDSSVGVMETWTKPRASFERPYQGGSCATAEDCPQGSGHAATGCNQGQCQIWCFDDSDCAPTGMRCDNGLCMTHWWNHGCTLERTLDVRINDSASSTKTLKVLRDFDGDGLPDFLIASQDLTKVEWCRNLGAEHKRFDACLPVTSMPPGFDGFRVTAQDMGSMVFFPKDDYTKTPMMSRRWYRTTKALYDVNRDGFPDYVVINDDEDDPRYEGFFRIRFYLHNGSRSNPGWEETPRDSARFPGCSLPDTSRTIPCLTLSYQEASDPGPLERHNSGRRRNRKSVVALVDINGDGFLDRASASMQVSSFFDLEYSGTTSVWYLGPLLTSQHRDNAQHFGPSSDETRVLFEDENGDLGGYYFVHNEDYQFYSKFALSIPTSIFSDFDGDGRAERVSSPGTSDPLGKNKWIVRSGGSLANPFGTGALWSWRASDASYDYMLGSAAEEGWDVDLFYWPTGFSTHAAFMAVADYDGDGLADVLMAPASVPQISVSRHGPNTVRRGLLEEVKVAQTLETHVSYRTSRHYPNQAMRSAVFVVEHIQSVDPHRYAAAGNEVYRYYQYADGLYDTERKEFRGFGKIWRKEKVGGKTRQTLTEYHISDALKGKPIRELMGPDGVTEQNWQRRTDWTWSAGTTYDRNSQSWPVHHLTAKRVQLRDGPGRDQWTLYDNFLHGRPRSTTLKGDPLTSADDVSHLQTYVLRDTGLDYLILPSLEEKLQGAVVWGRKRIHYDGLPFGTEPTQGRVTRTEVLVSDTPSETYKTHEFSYSGLPGQYGLASSWTSDGETRTMSYSDAGFVRQVDKPATSTPAMTWSYSWHPLSGKIESECGPQRSSSGFLRCSVINTYDGHGRLLQVQTQKSNGSTGWTPVVTMRLDYNDYPTTTPLVPRWVEKTIYPDGYGGAAPARTTRLYVDGAGQGVGQVASFGVDGAYAYTAVARLQGAVAYQTLPEEVSDDGFKADYLAASTSKTVFDYDLLGRKTSVTDPAGNVTTTQFAGDLVHIDRAGESTTLSYDAFGRLDKTAKDFGGTDHWMDFAYDVNNHIVSVGLDNGTRSRLYTRNLIGQLTRLNLPNGDQYDYSYWTAGGKLKRITDARQVWMETAYDDLKRVVSVSYGGDGGERPDVALPGEVSYSYFTDDARLGALWKICDSDHCTIRDVDARGRLVSLTRQAEGGDPAVELAYNEIGELTHRTFAGTNLGAQYHYDAAGRVSLITADSVLSIKASYSPHGAVSHYSVERDGETILSSDRTFDDAGRLASLTTTTPYEGCDQQLSEVAYTPRSAVSSYQDADGVASFSHDSWDRLTGRTGPGADWGYAYQTPGLMRILTAQSGGEQRTYSYGFGDAYQVSSIASSDGTRSFSYDEAGNVTQISLEGTPQHTLTWTPSNQLWSSVGESVGAHFRYSAGKRYRRTIRRGGNLIDDRLFVDDATELDLLEHRPTMHLGLGGVTLATVTEGERYKVYAYDISGARCVFDDGGDVGTRRYTPYGAVANNDGNDGLFDFGYKGYREIPALGWSRTDARIYSPSLRRWLSRDPLVLTKPRVLFRRPKAGDLYGYSSGDPLTRSDPSGLLDPHVNNLDPVTYSRRLPRNVNPKRFYDAYWNTSSLGGVFVLDLLMTILTEGAWAAYASERYAVVLSRQLAMRTPTTSRAMVIVVDPSSPWLKAKFQTVKKWGRHYMKHVCANAEWGKMRLSAKGYLERARRLLASRVGGEIRGFVSKEGSVFRYNAKTNEFAIGHVKGTIMTLFKPEQGLAYWLEQVAKYAK